MQPSSTLQPLPLTCWFTSLIFYQSVCWKDQPIFSSIWRGWSVQPECQRVTEGQSTVVPLGELWLTTGPRLQAPRVMARFHAQVHPVLKLCFLLCPPHPPPLLKWLLLLLSILRTNSNISSWVKLLLIQHPSNENSPILLAFIIHFST